MSRTAPPDRAVKVVEAAAAVFVDVGYRRAQMDDVAERLGVSKGTLYRSVASKDALLAAVLTYGDRPTDLPAGASIEAASLSAVAEGLSNRLASRIAALELSAAAAGTTPAARSGRDVARQVERMASELFEAMSRHRVGVMVVDRCAPEVPELAAWFSAGRYAVVDLWETYLAHVDDHVNGAVDRSVLARTVVELVTLWAVKMPWDPSPRPYPADVRAGCASMVTALVMGGRS